MRLAAHWLLALGLAASSGCFHLQPLAAPQADCQRTCHELPRGCRNGVYVFLLNGLDPGNCANLTGLRDYLHELGFIKTYYGQLHHTTWFAKEMRRIHCEEPDARFVLIGFDLGANGACSLARAVAPDGIVIDLMVYLSGSHLKDTADRQGNVFRVLNIQGCSRLDKGRPLTGAENVRIPEASHYGSPTHPYTLEALAHELAQVAALVPVRAPVELAPPPEADAAPTPRPVPAPSREIRDEWDFLKPVSRLGQRPGPGRP